MSENFELKPHFYERFDNGVRVIIDDNGSGTELVEVQVWIKIGSSAENPDEHGCAHLLEHMLFESKFGEDHLIAKVEQLGGTVGAFTSEELTVVYTTVPTSNYLRVLELLLDAVCNPVVNAEKLEIEKSIVVQEAALHEGDPECKINANLLGIFFENHAYGRYPIGTVEEINSLDSKRLKEFHRELYTGKNISVIVAGNASRDETVFLCKKYLEHLPDEDRKVVSESCNYPRGVRIDRHDWKFNFMSIMFPGPTRYEYENVLALGIAGDLLESYLHEQLCSTQIAINVTVGTLALRQGGRLSISIVFQSENVEKVFRRAIGAIREFVRFPILKDVFNEAKDQIRTSLIYGQESVTSRATLLGMISSSDEDSDLVEKYFGYVDRLTSDKVQETIENYLKCEKACTYLGVPKDEISEVEGNHLVDTFEEVLCKNRPKNKRSGITPDKNGINGFEFKCGLRLHAVVDTHLPIVSGALVWPGGELIEPKDQAGITRLLMGTMSVDDMHRDFLERELNKICASLSRSVSMDHVGFKFSSTKEYVGRAIGRTFDLALRPTFTQKDLERNVTKILESRKILDAQLDIVAQDKMHKILFGDHPWGRNKEADEVEKFSLDDLVDVWKGRYPIKRAVLGLAGDFDLDLVIDQLECILNDVSSEGDEPVRLDLPIFPNAPRFEKEAHPLATSSYVSIGWPAIPSLDPKWESTLEVLERVIKWYLFETVRMNHGLVYHIDAGSHIAIDSGCIFINTEVNPENAMRVCELIDQEVERICKESVNQVDLKRVIAGAKTMVGSMLERRSSMANAMSVDAALYQSPTLIFEEIAILDGITAEDVKKLANELFDLQRQVTVIVEPSSGE